MPASASRTPAQTRPATRCRNSTSERMGVIITLQPTAKPDTADGRLSSATACAACPTPNMTPSTAPLIHTCRGSPEGSAAG
ncbi:hypothetical protein ACFQYP_03295 [Nonomuraea antimicrobica]